MLDIPRILAGLVLSTLIGGVAYRRGSLTRSGWLGAIITGTATFGFGGWAWGLTLIVFFMTSTLLSRFRQGYKQRVAGDKFEKGSRRDLGQTLANGGAGAALALVYLLSGESALVLALFAGTMATVTADTWATELGVLSRRPPRLVTTFRPVVPGTSGGVTLVGIIASTAGAGTIGVALSLLMQIEHTLWLPWLIPAALLGGIAGSLTDSAFGATLQALYRTPQGEETERPHGPDGTPHPHVRGLLWMNNDVVNFLSSLVGAVVALLVFFVVT